MSDANEKRCWKVLSQSSDILHDTNSLAKLILNGGTGVSTAVQSSLRRYISDESLTSISNQYQESPCSAGRNVWLGIWVGLITINQLLGKVFIICTIWQVGFLMLGKNSFSKFFLLYRPDYLVSDSGKVNAYWSGKEKLPIALRLMIWLTSESFLGQNVECFKTKPMYWHFHFLDQKNNQSETFQNWDRNLQRERLAPRLGFITCFKWSNNI